MHRIGKCTKWLLRDTISKNQNAEHSRKQVTDSWLNDKKKKEGTITDWKGSGYRSIIWNRPDMEQVMFCLDVITAL